MKKINYKEIFSYLFFGVLTTLVNIITYYLFKQYLNINYQSANIIAWIISVTFAFITNKIFVFISINSLKKTIKEMFSFYGFRLLSLGFDITIMFVAISVLNINDLVSKVISNIVVIIINYLFSKIFIFKKK